MKRLCLVLAFALFAGCLWNSPREGMKRQRLPVAEEIQGTSCAQGHAWFHKNGVLSSCALAEDSRVNGVDLPRWTTVFFDKGGTLDYCWLSETTEIQGFHCKGKGHSTMTGFYPSGRLKYFWPPEDLVVDGVPCKSTGLRGVYLHENGRLLECRLSKSTTIQEVDLRAGDDVEFDEFGWLLPVKRG